MDAVLVLLPPSETKLSGGPRSAPHLDLTTLAFPTLTAIRHNLITALVDVAHDQQLTAKILGISESLAQNVVRDNAALWSSPTVPAIQRYTGVLYDALDIATLSTAAHARAQHRLAIGSALFGAVRASDEIPTYRLSAESRIPNLGTLRSIWGPKLSAALSGEESGVVIDLRSRGYMNLGKVPGAITCDVVSVQADGSHKVVSHSNKHHKGLLARALVETRTEPVNIDEVARMARKAGLHTEIHSPTALVVVT